MILKNWCPEFNFKRDMIRIIPMWMKLPNTPLHHIWSASILGKIGSVIWKPLFTYECTSNKMCISFARILVEIDITKKQKDSIMIRDNEGQRIK